MCGILGVYEKTSFKKNRFHKSLGFLSDRGPDNISTKEITDQLVFGHTRLAIIDLESRSNQPFSDGENYHITFNGEIYNYLELKNELIDLGYVFTTNSDTEVLLKSYIQWGKSCVDKLNGMWSFAIYDTIKNILFCSRDRFGIKPFYYFFDQKKFIFSSLIRPILVYNSTTSFNTISISEFLYKGEIGNLRATWFNGINKLLPGENLVFDFKKIKIEKYYYLKYQTQKITFLEAKKSLENIFNDSLNLRLRSDVDICSTLTSGLDSSVIVSSLSKENRTIDTYTVYSQDNSFSKDDKKYFVDNVNMDETKFLNNFENNFIKTHKIELESDEFLNKLSFCVSKIESGHASPAIVGINQLYSHLKENKKKVLLEGQGSDEIFSGYITDMFFEVIRNHLYNFQFKRCVNFIYEILKIYKLKDILQRFYSNNFTNIIFISLKIYLTKTKISKVSFFNFSSKFENIHNRQQKSILTNLLLYGDKLSMANSIETRFPFLDFRLVNFANSLPLNYKVSGSKGKFILRETFKDILPEEIYDSKLKIGFAIPVDRIIKEDSKIKDILYDDIGFYFNQSKLNKLLDRYYGNKFRNYNFIFKILTIKLWYYSFKEFLTE